MDYFIGNIYVSEVPGTYVNALDNQLLYAR